MDVPLKEIRHLTLSDLSYYDDAHKTKEEMKDMWCWLMGFYVHEAVGVVASQIMPSKGAPPVHYRESPIFKEITTKNKELTEEEKQAQIAILFGNLEIMKSNFEATHGDKKCPT